MRSGPDRVQSRLPASDEFVLYVEGPRDREILRAWAYRLIPGLARRMVSSAVILGGRQPQRAIADFRRRGGAAAGARGLCILDRDDGRVELSSSSAERGLEFFTWSRRHIESYLLVPNALSRALCLGDRAACLDRVIGEHLPDLDDEDAFREVDAKRFLGPNGALPRALGRPVPLSGVARATRESELHPDVHRVFERMRGMLCPD